MSVPASLLAERSVIAYAWDAQSDILRVSANGVVESRDDIDVGVPSDTAMRIGQTSTNREGRSWTEGFYYIPRLLSEEELAKITELP